MPPSPSRCARTKRPFSICPTSSRGASAIDWLSVLCIARAGLGASTVSSAPGGSVGVARTGAAATGASTFGAAKDDIDRLRIAVRGVCCCLVSNRFRRRVHGAR